MTAIERLELYEIALKDYESGLMIEKKPKVLQRGLCNYFYIMHDIDTYWCLEVVLPEIYKLSPLNHGYYFPEGELEPRIELLKKAIELVKTKL